MKHSFMKKSLSVFFALVMVLSIIPVTAYAKATVWTEVASTDFTKSTLDNKTITGDNSATVQDGDKKLYWTVEPNGNYDVSIDSSKGLYLEQTAVYLSGYEDSDNAATPITGASAFKIDLEFSTGLSASTNDRYALMTIGTSSIYSLENKEANNSAYALSQDMLGNTYVRGSKIRSGNSYNGLSTDNGRVSSSSFYHYVVTYSNGYLRINLTDSDYQIIENLVAYKPDGGFTTSDICSLCLGCYGNNWNWYMNKQMTYKSIKFYTGEEQGKEDAQKDSSRNKFLFAYFTGQNDSESTGEKIRLAVSTDGINFEALNGNNPILSNTPSAYYPSDGASKGKAASGCARDPYILQKRNADGSVADGYYVLATDLKVNGSDYTNSKLLVWSLDDITQVDTVYPWSLETTGWFGHDDATDFYAWAPEAIWDNDKNMYMMYWSASDTGYSDMTIYYAYTNDFKTFYKADGSEIGKNNAEPDKLIWPHWSSSAGTNKAIDGDITYDGQYYWLYFKREAEQQIYAAHAESPNGPYSDYTQFVDKDFSSSLEGVEVYELNDGSHILMMDYYSNNGNFIMYKSPSGSGIAPSDFEHNSVTTSSNINHLSPRHGAVTYITTAEYNSLVEKFGKSTYAADGILDGSDVNDYLIARYYTTADNTYDATNHGYTLSSAGVTTDINDGKTVGKFDGNVSSSIATSTLTKMYNDYGINSKDGITLDWYGYANSADTGRFFELSTSSTNNITWSSDGSVTPNQNSYPYVFCASKLEYGANGSAATHNTVSSNAAWHHYTMTVTAGYVNFFVDGVLQSQTYTKDVIINGTSSLASPLTVSAINDSWFKTLFTEGTFRFGPSIFKSDATLNGYIHDFRIYSKAISQSEVEKSISALSSNDMGMDASNANSAFYDPMETVADQNKTAYDGTVTDETYGEVLDLSKQQTATHNPTGGYTPNEPNYDKDSTLKKGYTVSLLYNPGSTVESKTVFNIGRANSVDSSNKQYFELLEDGTLYFQYEENGTQSYIDITDAFGDNTLPTNDWSHIVIQIAPDGTYDTIKIYLNGSLVKTVSTYNNSYNKSLASSHTVYNYFAKAHDVSYGTGCGYYSVNNDGMIDNFNIYCGLYSANSIFKNDMQDVANTLLDKAINTYKEKMAQIAETGHVYTNMAAAYTAYDRVVRYKDAIDPAKGNISPDVDQIITLYKELCDTENGAIAKMQEYVSPTTKNGQTAADTGLKSAIPDKFAHNMLTGGDMTTKVEYTGGTTHEMNAGVYRSSFAWLYTGIDGDTPTAPINVGLYVKENASFNQYIHYSISVKDSSDKMDFADDIIITGNKIEKDKSLMDYFYYEGCTTNLASQLSNGSKYLYRSDIGDGSTTTWFGGSSYLKFTGDSSFAKKSDSEYDQYALSDYYIIFTPSYNSHTYRSWLGGKSYYDNTIEGNVITVYSFVPANAALTEPTKQAVLANITEYNPSVVNDMLAKYDAVTSIDYISNATNANGNTSTTESFAKEIKKAVDELNGVATPSEENKKADDTKAKEAVTESTPFYDAAKIVDESGNVTGGQYTDINTDSQGNVTYTHDETKNNYTTSTWTAYANAYNALQEYYAGLDPFTTDYEYATSQNQLDTMASHITDAFDSLVEAADYDTVDAVTGEGVSVDNASTGEALNTHSAYTDGNGANYQNQTWTISTWDTFNTDYNDSLSWSNKSASYRADTEKYAISFELNAAGPYIAYDKDDKIVTSDSQTPYYYVYIGEFYDNAGDEDPSQFETGDYVLINGEYVQLNGHRYYSTGASSTDDSTRQAAIKTSAAETQTSCSALATVDTAEAYQNYNSAQSIFANSDQNAYNTATKDTIASYGSTTSAKDYTGSNKAVYVTYNGAIYYNTTVGGTDTYTSTILNDINDKTDATRNVYHITFEVYTDGVLTETVKDKEAHVYGDVVNLTYTGSDTVVSWVVSNSTATTAIKNTSNTYKVQIQEDSTAKVYVTTPDSEKVEVLVKDYFGRAKAYYVAAGTTATVSGSTITFSDGQVANNVECNYMAFTSFTKGGEEIADGTVYAITEATTFVAKGTTAADTMTYKVTGGTFADGSTVAQYKVDDKITITADDENCLGIALATDDGMYVLTYDSTYSIFAFPVADTFNGTVNFVVLTNDDAEGLLDKDENGDYIKAPQSYGVGVYNASTSKLSMYCTMSTGSGATITERGVLLTRGSNNTADTFIKGATDVKTFRANNDINAASYMYSIKLSSTANVYARSYVCYEIKTSLNGIDVTVPLVAYGPVVSA